MRELVMDGSSLAPVAIKEVMELEAKSVSSVWDRSRKSKIEALGLFDEPKPLEKIPFEFRFRWQDYDGIEHDSLVISWEMAQTWRQYRDRYSDPIAEMKAKLLGDYFGPERNPSFFMGNHSRFRNTFMVCGWFIPPKSEIGNEFLW